jgi:hypothetical protein
MSDQQPVAAAASADTLTGSLERLNEKWKSLPPHLQGQLVDCWRHDHRLAERAQRFRHALWLVIAMGGWYALLGIGLFLLARGVFSNDSGEPALQKAALLGVFVIVAGAPPLMGLIVLRRYLQE